MLKKFSVTNFRGLKDKYCIDFTKKSNYNWNNQYVNNDIVKNAMIYGKSGSGKSNLGMAMQDAALHLQPGMDARRVNTYINADTSKEFVEFEYIIKYSNKYDITYKYIKTGPNRFLEEAMYLNEEVIFINNYKDKTWKVTDSLLKKYNLELSNDISTLKHFVSVANKNEVGYMHPIHYAYRFLSSFLYCTPFHSNEYVSLFRYLLDNLKNTLQDKFNAADIVELINLEFNDLGFNYKLEYNQRDNDLDVVFGNKTYSLSDVSSSGEKSAVFYVIMLEMYKFMYFQYDIVGEKLKHTIKLNGKTIKPPKKQFYIQFHDEFDAFYDIELSKRILVHLSSQDNIQSIASSHNTNLISNKILRPDCYYIINNGCIKNLPQLTDKEIRIGHSLEKMFIAGEFVFNGIN